MNKGDLANITGRLGYEVYETNGKGHFNLFAFRVEPPQAAQPEAADEDCPY